MNKMAGMTMTMAKIIIFMVIKGLFLKLVILNFVERFFNKLLNNKVSSSEMIIKDFRSSIFEDNGVYTCKGFDPDGDHIKYCFDWGDGTSSWTNWTNSNITVRISHTWTQSDNYKIRVKIRDENGLDSEWSDPLAISMTKSKNKMSDRRENLFTKFIYVIFSKFI